MNQLDLGDLSFIEGGHLLVKRAMGKINVGKEIVICGQDPDLEVHVEAWARNSLTNLGISCTWCSYRRWNTRV